MKKGTKLYSIFKNKCPRCHEGHFFTYSNPYDLSTFTDMPDACPVCKQSYQPEPGYYYGAMYVSYALNVALLVAVWVATAVLAPDISTWWFVGLAGLFGVGLAPITFRLARLIWINFFVRYKPASSGSVTAQQ